MSSKDQEKKKSSGSLTLAERGMGKRCGDNAMAPLDRLCVIGGHLPGDMTEAEARALWPKDKRAQEVISAILDVLRAGEPCPEFFWHTCRTGIVKAVQYVDLGPAKDGCRYNLIVDGRHRKSAAFEVTQERAALNDPLGAMDVPSLAVPLPADPIAAAAVVRRIKTVSNIHVPMSPSSLAARAFEHDTGASHYAIGVTIGLRAEIAEQEVPRLLALAMCEVEIQRAVDAEPDLLPVIGKWRRPSGELSKSPEEQRAWLAARLTPKARKPRPEVRPLPPKKIAALAHELRDVQALAPLLSLLLGQTAPKDITDPELRAAALRAWGDGS